MLVVLPGMSVGASFSLVWPSLYQFLFSGYCFWGNLCSPYSGLSTLNNRILTPIGRVIDADFSDVSASGGVGPGLVSVLAGMASLTALCALSILNALGFCAGSGPGNSSGD